MFRLGQNRLLLGAFNPIQKLVHGFLGFSIGVVKLARSLGGKLTEHISVPQSVQCIKNAIRTHDFGVLSSTTRAIDGSCLFQKATFKSNEAAENRRAYLQVTENR